MDLDFKLADSTDADMLLGLMREFYELDRHAFDERQARAALQELQGDDSFGRVWLIQSGGAPVGYVALTLGFSLEYHGRVASVDEIYIRAEHRGRGFGTETLKFVEGVCRALGARALHLEVGRLNAGAQAVYRKFGFEEQDSLLMTKRLTS